MKRQPNESYFDYCKRITEAKKNGLIDTYAQWSQLLLGDSFYADDNSRKSFYLFEKFLERMADEIPNMSEKDLENMKFEIMKERKKLQAVNLEYQANGRSEGRYELFLENIETAINNLNPITIKPSVYTEHTDLETTGVLYIADAHVGRDVEMFGLFGEVTNKYDIKEFETRMWNLLNKMENEFYDMKINKLDVCDLGDNIEGILRIGESLKNLKSGVVDATVYYAEFMANWIIECHNRLKIPVRYSLTSGNHDVLRLLDGRPNFEEETVGKFIYKIISLRVENAVLKAKSEGIECNIEIEPYNDVSYHNYYGLNVLTYHGDGANLENTISFFEDYYNVTIDLLIAGHLHRYSTKTIGVGNMGDKEIIHVPSICGIDTYSKKIRKNARAGALFKTFNRDGANWTKIFYLN